MGTLEELILAEHSKKQRDRIIKYVSTDSEKVSELVSLFLNGSSVVQQRSAYVIGSIEDVYPCILKQFYPNLVRNLCREKLHPAIPRNTLRLIERCELDKEHTGIFLDVCFRYLENTSLPVAIHAFSLSCIYEHGKEYPELMNELKLIVEDRLPYALPAFKHRGMKILKRLTKSE